MLDKREELEGNEYSFEDGVDEAVRKIREISATQDYVVVSVSGPISSSDVNVGKTSFSGRILQAFPSAQGIVFQSVGSDGDITPLMRRQLDTLKAIRRSDKCLILLNATGTCDSEDPTIQDRYRNNEAGALRRAGERAGLPLSKIDLRILVYRPDRPISKGERGFADMTVRNDFAGDS